MTTSLDRLDELLGGGLPRCSLVTVAGLPGAGKSILVFHVLARQALEGQTTLYLSTTHQPVSKFRAQYSSLDFLTKDGLMDRIGLRSLDPESERDLTSLLKDLVGLIRERDYRVVAIESFRAIASMAQGKQEIWQFLSQLSTELVSTDCTALLVGEYRLPDDLDLPEFAMSDVVLGLEVQRQTLDDHRLLRVYKMGGPHQAGANAFLIDNDGIQFLQA